MHVQTTLAPERWRWNWGRRPGAPFAAPSFPQANLAQGAVLYKATCTICHGATGLGCRACTLPSSARRSQFAWRGSTHPESAGPIHRRVHAEGEPWLTCQAASQQRGSRAVSCQWAQRESRRGGRSGGCPQRGRGPPGQPHPALSSARQNGPSRWWQAGAARCRASTSAAGAKAPGPSPRPWAGRPRDPPSTRNWCPLRRPCD